MDKVVWSGQSGRSYEYDILLIGGAIPSLAGNYAFCKNEVGGWRPVYVGETGNLNTRISNHHQMPCIERNGATHVSYRLTSGSPDARLAEEKDIRERYSPSCNGGTGSRLVWDAVGELKDALNELHPITIRIKRAGQWHELWDYVEALASAVRAAAVYDRDRPVADQHVHSSELLALFAAFSKQKEAVNSIARIAGMDWEPKFMKKNDTIRNRLLHPETGYVLQHPFDKPKFQLIRYPIKSGSNLETKGVIDAGERQDAQIKGMQDKIGSIIAHLRREQQEWAKQEQAKGSLWDILEALDYPIEKVGDSNREWEIGMHAEVAAAFARLRGRLIEMEYEDHFFSDLDAASAGLEMWREDIAKPVRSESSASFLMWSLRYYLARLRGFTAALDDDIDDDASGRDRRERQHGQAMEDPPANYEAAMRALDAMSTQNRDTIGDEVTMAAKERRRKKDADAYRAGRFY